MLEVITCVLGTLGFCVILNISKRKLFYSVFGGLISSVLLVLLTNLGAGTFEAVFISMLVISVYSEALSRITKTPANIILLPASIPLLPGGSLYYMMSFIVHFDRENFVFYAKETALTGLGIALGAVVISIIVKIINSRKKQV
uniref:threonine/serine exporter family protein n=1 Tax=Eubacterium sp. TaxID=142586 RepID=UPI004024EF6B